MKILKDDKLFEIDEVDERSPIVFDKLYAHYPMDYRLDSLSHPNVVYTEFPNPTEKTYSGTDYQFHLKTISISDLEKDYGYNRDTDYICCTVELKVDSERNLAGGSCKTYMFTTNSIDTWISSSEGVSNSTEYNNITFSLSPTKMNILGSNNKLADDIHFSVYHYPSTIDVGESSFRNVCVYISKHNIDYGRWLSPNNSIGAHPTNEGVIIRREATNLITNPYLENDVNGWEIYDINSKISKFQRVKIYDFIDPNITHAVKVEYLQNNIIDNLAGININNTEMLTADTYYMKTLYVKGLKGTKVKTTNSNISTWTEEGATTLTGGWDKIQSLYYNETITQSDNLFFSFWREDGQPFEIYATAATLTKGGVGHDLLPTSTVPTTELSFLTPGITADKTGIDLDNDIVSYVLKLRISNNIDTLSTVSRHLYSSTYKYRMLCDWDTTLGGVVDSIWSFIPSYLLYLRDGTDVGGTSNFIGDYINGKSYNDIMVTYIFNGYKTTIKLIVNGELTTNYHTRTGDIGISEKLHMLNVSIDNGVGSNILKSLTIYNKELSDEEVLSIYNGTSIKKIDKDTSLVLSKITENNPFGAILHDDATSSTNSNYLGNVKPINDSYIDIMGYGSSYGSTNLVKNSIIREEDLISTSYSPGWDDTLHVGAVEPPSSWSSGYNVNQQTTQHAFWAMDNYNDQKQAVIHFHDDIETNPLWLGVYQTYVGGTFTLNDYVTMSIYAKSDTDGAEIQFGLYHYMTSELKHGFGDVLQTKTIPKKNKWYKLYFTFQVDSDFDTSKYSQFYIYGHKGIHARKYVMNPYMEKSIYPTVFSENSTIKKTVKYNLSGDHNLDWSKDWTISYWKYAVGTTNNKNNLNKDSLDSLGQEDGGTTGYIFFGKTSDANGLGFNIPQNEPNDINNYFNNWVFTTLTHNSTNNALTSRFFMENEEVIVDTKYSTISTNTRFLKEGFDLNLGGYKYNGVDHYNACYYKGLNVWQLEKTEEELTKIYNTGLKISKENHDFSIIGEILE